MLSVTRHLPKAYSRPLATDLPKTELFETPQSQKGNSEHIIEADWRPISGSPVRSANIYQNNSELFTDESKVVVKNHSPALATARYQQMTPQPHQQRGTILDIMV